MAVKSSVELFCPPPPVHFVFVEFLWSTWGVHLGPGWLAVAWVLASLDSRATLAVPWPFQFPLPRADCFCAPPSVEGLTPMGYFSSPGWAPRRVSIFLISFAGSQVQPGVWGLVGALGFALNPDETMPGHRGSGDSDTSDMLVSWSDAESIPETGPIREIRNSKHHCSELTNGTGPLSHTLTRKTWCLWEKWARERLSPWTLTQDCGAKGKGAGLGQEEATRLVQRPRWWELRFQGKMQRGQRLSSEPREGKGTCPGVDAMPALWQTLPLVPTLSLLCHRERLTSGKYVWWPTASEPGTPGCMRLNGVLLELSGQVRMVFGRNSLAYFSLLSNDL